MALRVSTVFLICALTASLQAADIPLNSGSDVRSIEVIGGRTYVLGTIRVKNSEAMVSCNDLGMVLASLETQEENQLVQERLVELGFDINERFHVNGFYQNSRWRWATDFVNYDNWTLPIKPDATSCLVLHLTGWHLSLCETTFPYICEQKC